MFKNRNPQTNSFLDNDDGNRLSFPEDTEHLASFDVDVQTLAGWCSRHLPEGELIIKADVQGAELELINGGHETFRSRVIAFYTEVQIAPMYREQSSFAMLNDRLSGELEFSLYNLYPCLRDRRGRAVQLDALWVKETALVPDKQRSQES